MTHIDETWYQRPPNVPTRIDAGGVVARLEDGRVLVALAREADWPLFILPKGGVEVGESLEQAARREIAEEAGLTELRLLVKLGVRERLSHDRRRWNSVHYFLFATSQVEGAPTDLAHHYGVWWHPLRALPEMLWPEQLDLLRANAEDIERLVRQKEPG
jgi:ADP-ribose pyrophosphatase YjhB (NUDIX family)